MPKCLSIFIIESSWSRPGVYEEDGRAQTQLHPCHRIKYLFQSLCQCILISNELSNICLVENNNGHWIHSSTLLCRFRRYSKSKRYISHGIYNYSLVLLCVLSDSSKPGFKDMISIQKRLLRSRFHPHFVFCIGS